MDPDRTHYTTLGVVPDAPQQVVRAAYVALSKLHHPDSGTAPDERRMQEVNRAWQVLRDPVRRAAYDAALAAARPAATRPGRPSRPSRPVRGRSADAAPDPESDTASVPAPRPAARGHRGWGEPTPPGGGSAETGAGDRAATRPGRRGPVPRFRRRNGDGDGDGDRDGREPFTPPRGQPAAGWGEFVDDPDDADDQDEDDYLDAWDGERDPTAVTSRRVVAFVVDLVAVAALAYVLWYLLVLAFYEQVERPTAAGAHDVCRYVESTTATCHVFGTTAYFHRQYWPVALAVAVPVVLIHVVLQARTGATPGKALMALRTVREDGAAPGWGRALTRTVLLVLVDGAVWCVPVVGLSQIRTNAGHRRIGDRVARTYVVTRSAAGRPIVVPPPLPPD